MKRKHTYEIDLINKTVVVSKKFMDKATQYGSDEFELLDNFQRMGLRIINQTRTTKSKKEESKKLLSYQMMHNYLAMLDDADDMLREFETQRKCYASDNHRLKFINDWFRKECPNYGKVPEFDENYRIVHNPNPVITSIAANH